MPNMPLIAAAIALGSTAPAAPTAYPNPGGQCAPDEVCIYVTSSGWCICQKKMGARMSAERHGAMDMVRETY